ncbi:hypothetical protein [Bradyrhizobium sp. HKCCYLR20261]|uniref:hypothetical protein n=1 Tax=Bradyrhizobium sp. HKCCYLR20261 TaxID=3420760 RepID=UPI003EBCB2CF
MTTRERELVLDTPSGKIRVLDEPSYTFGSTDNLRRYESEYRLDDSTPYSIYGVSIDGKWSVVFGAGRGPTTVHQHSAVELNGRLFLAIGNQVVCLDLQTAKIEWSLEVDWASCFGVYWDDGHHALISHGELQISRLSLKGEKIWATDGRDIFTEGFRCLPMAIEVIDFNQEVYQLDYLTGRVLNRR